MKKIDLSIIIVNYKVEKELLRCLESIYKKIKNITFEIVVVENDSKTNLKSKLKKFSFLKYVKAKKNLGYGSGCNLGAKYANGEYLFFLNPDTEIIKSSNEAFRILLDRNVGIVAPLLLDSQEKPYLKQGTMRLTPWAAIFSLSFIYKFFPDSRIARKFWLSDWNKKSVKEVDVVPGTAFFIKSDIFGKIGEFDEKFFLFFEEHDLCNKVKESGYTILISPKFQVMHLWGKSMEKEKNTNRFFKESRKYYFRKYYGIFGFLIDFMFLGNFFKEFLVISGLIFVSLFLRIYNLHETMQFIPDQGWFYLSARDMLLSSQIPLVGPPTSHPWIHHGPLWTYTLGGILWMFNFDPVMPAYFIAILGTITVGVFYFITKKMYPSKIALTSTILFASSPLVIMNSRIPYHTSPIPFLVIILFYLTYLWIKGKIWVFPFIAFLLGILYNHEITTFVYAICIFILLFFGFITKKKWATGLTNMKLIIASIVGFMIPMIPFILYDIQHGYKQTAGFLVWVGYRIIKLPLSIFDKSFISSGSNPSTFSEFFLYYKDLIFSQNNTVAFLILSVTIIGTIYLILKNKIPNKILTKKIFKLKLPVQYVLLALFLSISFLGLLIHRVPIEADTLLIAPFILILTVIIASHLIKNYFVLLSLIVVIGVWNFYILVSTNYFTTENGGNRFTHSERMGAVSKIIKLADGKKFNIKGHGELSDFPVFTMPYEYLLWWKGIPVSKDAEKQIIIWENHGRIEVYEND